MRLTGRTMTMTCVQDCNTLRTQATDLENTSDHIFQWLHLTAHPCDQNASADVSAAMMSPSQLKASRCSVGNILTRFMFESGEVGGLRPFSTTHAAAAAAATATAGYRYLARSSSGFRCRRRRIEESQAHRSFIAESSTRRAGDRAGVSSWSRIQLFGDRVTWSASHVAYIVRRIVLSIIHWHLDQGVGANPFYFLQFVTYLDETANDRRPWQISPVVQ